MAIFNAKSGAVWVVISQITLLVSNFLLLKLLTSHLSVESFGYYSLCMSITLFARQLLYDPVSIVVAKECATTVYKYEFISDGFRAVRYLTERIGLALLLLGSISLIFAYVLNSFYITGIAVWSCLVYLCANGAQGIYFNVLNSICDRKPAAVFSIFDSIFKIILVSLVFLLFEKTLVYILISISFSTFTIFISLKFFIENRFAKGESTLNETNAFVKRILLMSVPLYLPTLFTALKSVGDRWILAAFMGVEDLAAFTVLFQLGYLPMILIIGVVQTIVAPNVYRLCSIKSNKGFTELGRVLKIYIFLILIFACVASGVALSLSDWIFRLMVGKDYYIFSNYLPFFVVAGALAAIAGILHLTVIGVFETKFIGKLMVTSVVISVAGASLLTIIWGLVGAIVGLVTSSAITAFIYWLALHRLVFKCPAD